MLVRIELQRSRDRIEHLRRGVDVASLLEPCVPGDPKTRELSDLLPAKPRSAPAPQRAKPDLLGPDALSTAAEERPELLLVHTPILHSAWRWILVLPVPASGRRGA